MSTAPETATHFRPVPVGLLRGHRPAVTGPVAPAGTGVEVRYPTRLNAMALDPSKIVGTAAADDGEPRGSGHPAGELFVVCDLFRTARVEIVPGSDGVMTTGHCSRPVLARHAASAMRELLGITDGLLVHTEGVDLPPHVGLGSSSATMASVAVAINELYGRPVQARQLIRFLVDNHGEEIDGRSDSLMPVQCIGGSAAAGLIPGSVQVVAGNAVPLLSAGLPADYRIVLAMPADPTEWDAQQSLQEEARHFDDFLRTGRRHAPDIAYRLIHEAWPALLEGKVRKFGTLVFDYRFRMGSIKNCSFSHPRLLEFADAIEPTFTDGAADVLGLSSVGPLFFAVTRTEQKVTELFQEAGLRTFAARPWSEGYGVVRSW